METQLEYAGHFEEFLFDWNYKTYLAIGSYGSGKSQHTAIKIMTKLMQEKRRCAVIREVYDTHLDSTYQLFEEIAEVLDPQGSFIRFKKSPMAIEFANGSKIIFKGLDKVEKMKGLQGVSIVWIEEASEIKYGGYKELILRLRTKKQSLHIILSTNPVSEDNWVYTHFFENKEERKVFIDKHQFYEQRILKKEDDDLFVHHSTVDDNPFVPASYVKELDKMQDYDMDLWRVARLGHFGVLGKRVLPNIKRVPHHEVMSAIEQNATLFKNGLDFGFTESYNAFVQCAIDHERKVLYIYNEYYNRGQSDAELADALEPYKDEYITADRDNKTINYLDERRFKVMGARKGPGSVIAGLKKLRRFTAIVISDACPHAQREFTTLAFQKDKNDRIIEDKFTIDPHTVDATRYAIEDYEVAELKGFNARKKKRER